MIAAAVAAAALSCRPEPGVGTLTYTRGGREHALDLATCRDRILRPRLRIGYSLGYYGHRCWWLGC